MPKAERQLHIWTEAGALLLAVPFYVYLARQPYMPKNMSTLLYGLAATTVAVDGWLLYRWLST